MAPRKSIGKKKNHDKSQVEDVAQDLPISRKTRQSTTHSAVTNSTPNSTIHNKKKLTENDIENDLNNSEDEFKTSRNNETNVGKDKKSFSINNLSPLPRLVIKISKVTNKITCEVIDSKIGKNIRRNKRYSTSTKPRRSTRTTEYVNMNEDYLIKKQELHLLQNTSRKSKNQASNSRKRSVQSIGKQGNYENLEKYDKECETDGESECENKMDHANLSPKRPKSVNTPNATPVKSKVGKPLKNNIKHSTGTPSNENLKPKTPLKKSVQVSVDTPTKALSNLNLDGNSTPSSTRQRTLRAINLHTPSKENKSRINNTPTRLFSSFTKNNQSTTKTSAIRRLEKSNNEDEDFVPDEEVEESEEYDNDSDDYKEESESSDESYSGSDYSSKRPRTSRKNLSSMETPTKAMSMLSLRNSLTPSVKRRTVSIAKPSTPLQKARLKLHVSVLPKSLPCREEEFNTIYSFLHARLSDKSAGCIYISGLPGTGKTATVNEVIRCLKKLKDTGKLTEFEFVDINGMKLSEPRQAYVQIWKQLTGKATTWEEAHKLLQDRFTRASSKRGMTLLLVDELDLLCTKRQDVVYNLLDWPSKTNAKLVVVTIANTMDLPERVLMGKVTSRLGLTRLTFPPYNHKQLEEIVVSRLKGFNAFCGETIQLVARKVASVSGDARRALDICRRATEVAESNNCEVVTMHDVKRALDEMIASPMIQAIKHCSDMEKVFLEAVCAEVTRTGVEEVVFKNVYFQLTTLCTFNGEKTPNVTEALAMCNRLGSWRLLLCDHSKLDIHQRVLLNVSTDDVHFAIQSAKS